MPSRNCCRAESSVRKIDQRPALRVNSRHADPKYILDLLKSFITASMETMKIVNGLPALKERMAEKK
jgi:hypothetical protein